MVAASLAPGASPAVAQEELPENNAGTGEYVEPVPDAGGDRPADPRDGGGSRRLPPGVRDELPGGDEGRILERLATDPGSGAQDGSGAEDGTGDSKRGRTRERGTLPSRAGEDKGAVEAVVGAAVDPDNPVSFLFLAVGGIALGALAIAARRRSRS